MAVPVSTPAQERSGWDHSALDGLLALALFAATAIAVRRHDPGHGIGASGAGWDAVRYTLAAVSAFTLVARRAHPLLALTIIAPSVALLIALGEHGPGQITIGFAVFSATAFSRRRLSPVIVAGLVALVLAGALAAPGGPEWAPVIAGPACVLVGSLAGENARNRQAAARELVERAHARERDREDRFRQAAADERVRIARDLHDVVAHSMSVIAVRSGAARMVAETNPHEARAALAIIEETSRETLRELRRIVGVLRRADDDGIALVPAPRLADIPELVRSIQATGTDVQLDIDGEPYELAEGIEVSAYRIVQEALTNVVRHAGPTEARLSIRYRPAELEIEVVNTRAAIDMASDGTQRSAQEPGHGLIGMRERVAVYGGDLRTGPDGAGYRVVARLPVRGVL